VFTTCDSNAGVDADKLGTFLRRAATVGRQAGAELRVVGLVPGSLAGIVRTVAKSARAEFKQTPIAATAAGAALVGIWSGGAWLAERLAEAPDQPTLIFMHHPPVVAGIDWMDPAPDEPWMERLRDVLTGQAQVQAIHCGHLHRQITTQFAGIPLGVTPSVAPLVAMDLTPIDQDVPDNRELITTEPPTYAIHRWDGVRLVSHYERVGDWQVLARFNTALQPMIEGMFAERD